MCEAASLRVPLSYLHKLVIVEMLARVSSLAATESSGDGRHSSSHCVAGCPTGHAVPRELAQFTKAVRDLCKDGSEELRWLERLHRNK